MKYGKEQLTYELVGRVHLDYLELYRKYTYHEMHSYSLDAISEYELGRKKVAYEGTLDQLYNEDFYKTRGSSSDRLYRLSFKPSSGFFTF